MPELPDLEVAKNVLNHTLKGRTIVDVEIGSTVVLRRPTAEVFTSELQNRYLKKFSRYGKFLIFHFRPPAHLYINFMLVGRLRLQSPSDPKQKKMGFRFQLDNNLDLRYHDAKNMGKLYLLLKDESTSLIPNFDDQGPDALDPNLTLEVFRQRIQKFQAVIKHVLVNQRFIAGLGNAYADEILFTAHVLPFRKRSALTDSEIEALFFATKSVLQNAITTISARAGATFQFEIRDFLQVHGKGSESCPICGTTISSVKSGVRVANFCRECQK
ncbi:MAG: Fpg/Nei family DNA glycosylase [Candidatus Hermodarchaeota archaeon]